MRDRYDWSDEELEAEWTAAKANPTAVWAKDEYGADIVSLLKFTKSASARELLHKKNVSTSEQVEAENVAETFSSSTVALPVGGLAIS